MFIKRRYRHHKWNISKVRLLIFGKLSLLFLLLSCDAEKQIQRPPNVIIILADDQGWGDFSMNGNPFLETPNIDEMAKNGAVFNQFYVSPFCSPTRAELLTGRYAARGGISDVSAGGERLDLDEQTLADIFRQEGYATAAFGKWHNGMQYPYHPNGRGFEEYYGFASGHWGNYFSPMLERNGRIVRGDGFLPDDLTNQAMRFMEEQDNRPFFLYLPLNTPHSPMQVPDAWWQKWKERPIYTDHRYSTKEDIEHTKAAYALCENIDWNVGRLLTKLKELAQQKNTIVVYLSDNGPNGWRWNGGLKGIKGHLDEGGVRTPCILQWEGTLEKGKQVDQIASAMDLMPTLLGLAGIDLTPSAPLDGKSLVPLLENQAESWQARNIVSHWKGQISVRSQRFRLDASDRLFDMEQDVGQTEDVASAYPEVHIQLKAYKANWRKEVLSELPAVDIRPFLVGHPEFPHHQLPVRDAKASGSILRSNKYPNCSFFTHWTDTKDSITWDIEVVDAGLFEVELYHTAPKESIGTQVQLSFLADTLSTVLQEAHDPPLEGAAMDRVPRQESYVKDFQPLNMGMIRLAKGKGKLTLKLPKIVGEQGIDVRLLMLHRKSAEQGRRP